MSSCRGDGRSWYSSVGRAKRNVQTLKLASRSSESERSSTTSNAPVRLYQLKTQPLRQLVLCDELQWTSKLVTISMPPRARHQSGAEGEEAWPLFSYKYKYQYKLPPPLQVFVARGDERDVDRDLAESGKVAWRGT